MLEAQQAFVSDFIGQAFGLPIAHENANYEPTPGAAWVRLRCFPGQVVPGAIDAGQPESSGFWQFTLHYPLGEGAIGAKAQAQTIFDAYPLGGRVSYGGSTFQVTAQSQFDASPQGGWFQVVGRIFYEKES